MNFKVGQRVVCISAQQWVVGNGPKKDEVVTISEIGVGSFTGRDILCFEEYGNENGYMPEYFRPIIGESAISELTKFVEVVETSDCPIKSPKISEPCGS